MAVKKKKSKRPAYQSRCVTCGETFPSIAAEERHMEAMRHYRFELVL